MGLKGQYTTKYLPPNQGWWCEMTNLESQQFGWIGKLHKTISHCNVIETQLEDKKTSWRQNYSTETPISRWGHQPWIVSKCTLTTGGRGGGEMHCSALLNRGAICGDNVAQREALWKHTSTVAVLHHHGLPDDRAGPGRSSLCVQLFLSVSLCAELSLLLCVFLSSGGRLFSLVLHPLSSFQQRRTPLKRTNFNICSWQKVQTKRFCCNQHPQFEQNLPSSVLLDRRLPSGLVVGQKVELRCSFTKRRTREQMRKQTRPAGKSECKAANPQKQAADQRLIIFTRTSHYFLNNKKKKTIHLWLVAAFNREI